jgi:hypothetical protein
MSSDEEFQPEAERYYQGRVLHPSEWKKLQSRVLKQLSTTTVIILLLWFQDHLIEEFDDPSSEIRRLPGK